MLSFAAGLLLLVAGQTQPPLPDETRLPGERQPVRGLPAETELPGGINAPPETAGDLPAESLLPASWVQPTAPTASEEVLQAIDGGRSPDGVPRLSLNLKGHTGPVRAIAFAEDGNRLFTGGEGKRTLVWSKRGNLPGEPADWRHERTIRWQIQRGPRGRIQCFASKGKLLAIAGYGAWGTVGEILLVDVVTGQLITVLRDETEGNRDVVASLAISPDAQRPGIVSIDLSGRSVYWSPDPDTGNWSVRQLHPSDKVLYGSEIAAQLKQNGRQLAAVAMRDARHAVVPRYLPATKTWVLDVIDVATGDTRRIGIEHRQLVTAIAATTDGSLLATADGGSSLYLWDSSKEAVQASVSLASPCLSLSFRQDGQQLAAGMFRSSTSDPGVLVWDVPRGGAPRKQWEFRTSAHVGACQLSPDGGTLVFADGNVVVVQTLGQQRQQRIRAPLRVPRHVAFARDSQPGRYRVAIGTSESSAPAFDYSFDTQELQLSRTPIQKESWLLPAAQSHLWTLEAAPGGAWYLHEDGERRAKLPIDLRFDLSVSAHCFILDRQGRPFAVAVGTVGNGNIYLFAVADRGEAAVQRVFRGHASAVTSIAASQDRRYLASTSEDGTIRFWPLGSLATDVWSVDRWGAKFEVSRGKLLVATALKSGPLYFRGVREGDEITAVSWYSGSNAEDRHEATTAITILERLRGAPWAAQLVFTYVRGRAPAKEFQIFPAWQQLATLLVTEDREWAYWAPSGFYDASFEGHKLFGWQVNRGVERLPDFFLSSQLRKALERPEAMSQLLRAGDIESAFKAALQRVPSGAQRALVNAYILKPEISIDFPEQGQSIDGGETAIRATITTPQGEPLAVAKAFANGVVASLVEKRPLGQNRYACSWLAPLPADRRVLLQVVAATESEIVDVKSVTVDRRPTGRRGRPRIFIAAAGINDYSDAQIPRLAYAVRNAADVAQTLKRESAQLYRSQAVSLTDRNVTRPNWFSLMRLYHTNLRNDVRPDDVLVIYLSGHGVRDEEADDYFYLAANSRYSDVRSRRFESCISFQDIASFSDIPCRKIVILDTCHSGAIQPLRQRQLKAALRALQDDVFLTLTASEGNQEAAESSAKQYGRFTYRLLEAIRGAADRDGDNPDGVVTWSEVIAFVRRTVGADSLTAGSAQFPTAGPAELLDFVDFPVAAQ